MFSARPTYNHLTDVKTTSALEDGETRLKSSQMLGNSGDELTNMWGLLAMGITIAGIGLTLSHRIWRLVFFLAGIAFILSGLFWAPLRQEVPRLAVLLSAITVKPSNWFVLFIVALIVLWLHQWRKEIIAAIRHSDQSRRIDDLTSSLNSEIHALTEKLASSSPKALRYTINWTPWKLRSAFSLLEFSQILARLDPNGASTNESEAFKDLLIEEANAGRLDAKMSRDSYTRGLRPANFETMVSKSDAVKWAKTNSIDVSHIQ
jgi:hypothetical protein